MAIPANLPLYQLSFLELTSRSYKEASDQLVEAIGQGPINLRDLPSLAGRAMHLALAALLIIPIINTVVLIAMQQLGMYVAAPPREQGDQRQAADVEPEMDVVQEAHNQALEELTQILDRWVAASQNPNEQRAKAKEKVLYCFNHQGINLDLHSLSLSDLPEGIFAGLVNLREIILSDNQLSTLPAGVFAGLVNLREIALSNNELRTLPAEVFAELLNLEKIVLSYNRLGTLPEKIFAGLGALYSIDLSNNQLSDELPEKIFAGLDALYYIDLSNNQLSDGLPEIFFRGLHMLSTVSY